MHPDSYCLDSAIVIVFLTIVSWLLQHPHDLHVRKITLSIMAVAAPHGLHVRKIILSLMAVAAPHGLHVRKITTSLMAVAAPMVYV